MAVLDLQRRSLQIGRIRTGIQIEAKGGKMRPAKLATFRLTSGSRYAVESAAGLLGGEPRPWQNGPRSEWEVVTEATEFGIMVPPRDAVISSNYELWGRGGCLRRCDSQHEQKSRGMCLCPHAENPNDPDEVAAKALERMELAKRGDACSLITRINVMIPDLPGLGVWRLDTGSFYAAGEMIDQAMLLEMARTAGVGLPAMLRLEQRQSVSNGETRNFGVPVIDALTTARAIMTGELKAGGGAAQLPPAPGERPKAIAAGAPAQPTLAPGTPVVPPEPKAPETAQEIADLARKATTREQVRAAWRRGDKFDVLSDLVCTDQAEDEWQELKGLLATLSDALPDDRKPAAETAVPAEAASDALFDEGAWPVEAQR